MQQNISSNSLNLDEYLPLNHKFKALHICSHARENNHLLCYAKDNQNKPLKTYKINHFFTLSHHDETPLLGLEVYNYITIFKDKTENLYFVAKADTTGLKLLKEIKFKASDIIEGFLKYLIRIDISQITTRNNATKETNDSKIAKKRNIDDNTNNEILTVQALKNAAKKLSDHSYYNYIISKRRDGQYDHNNNYKTLEIKKPIKTQISMFTRPERQYLFPESYKNSYKHGIDGKQLLNWWLNILNKVMSNSGTWNCKLSIPGSDEKATSNFYQGMENWSYGSIFSSVEGKKLAIYDIPLFPDDPKGRFLEHLVSENRYKNTSTNLFWEELGIRQEFRLGILVAIIGCETDADIQLNTTDLHPLSFLQYKSIVSLYKEQDYLREINTIKKDIREKLNEIGVDFLLFNGTKNYLLTLGNHKSGLAGVKTPTVNNLTGLVKRRKK